jgi:hypothetical protein
VGGRRLAARLREHHVVEADVREGGRHMNGWRGIRVLTEARAQFSNAKSDDP